MRVNVAIPETHVDAPVLDAALEAVTKLNESLIKSGDAPTFTQMLANGVKWKPEPPGAEHFDHAGIVAARGWGDCDDLAPARAAELRVTGQDPFAKAVVKKSGTQTWHAVVQRGDGRIDDPSVAAGMRSSHAISGAALPLMSAGVHGVNGAFIMRPQIALRPTPNGWQARTDLPWSWRPKGAASPAELAMATLHQTPIAPTALSGSIDGAILLGEASGHADPEHLERLKCFSDYINGMPIHECAAVYGHEHACAAQQVVGSFWSHLKGLAMSPLHLAQQAAHFASPFTGMMRMVPGFGPMAAAATDFVAHPPTSFHDLANFAAHEGAGFVPGIGPAMAAAMPGGMPQMHPGMGMPQQMPQMPQQWPGMMPQQWPGMGMPQPQQWPGMMPFQ